MSLHLSVLPQQGKHEKHVPSELRSGIFWVSSRWCHKKMCPEVGISSLLLGGDFSASTMRSPEHWMIIWAQPRYWNHAGNPTPVQIQTNSRLKHKMKNIGVLCSLCIILIWGIHARVRNLYDVISKHMPNKWILKSPECSGQTGQADSLSWDRVAKQSGYSRKAWLSGLHTPNSEVNWCVCCLVFNFLNHHTSKFLLIYMCCYFFSTKWLISSKILILLHHLFYLSIFTLNNLFDFFF